MHANVEIYEQGALLVCVTLPLWLSSSSWPWVPLLTMPLLPDVEIGSLTAASSLSTQMGRPNKKRNK